MDARCQDKNGTQTSINQSPDHEEARVPRKHHPTSKRWRRCGGDSGMRHDGMHDSGWMCDKEI